MENFGKFMSWTIALILSPIINGFLLTKLWHWFIVPTFDTIELRVIEAIGIIYIHAFFTLKRESDSDMQEENKLLNISMFLIFKFLFILSIGWIASLFM